MQMSIQDGALTAADMEEASAVPLKSVKAFNPFAHSLAPRSSPQRPLTPGSTGTGREIRNYFAEVEELAGHLQFSERDAISMAIYYAHDDQRALFKSFKSAFEDDWNTFKSNMLDHVYPDAYFDMHDLQKYLRDFWARRNLKNITTQDIRKFYGGFLLILDDVQEKSKPKHRRKETGEMLLQALPTSVRSKVMTSLAGTAGGVITPHRVYLRAVEVVENRNKDSLTALY